MRRPKKRFYKAPIFWKNIGYICLFWLMVWSIPIVCDSTFSIKTDPSVTSKGEAVETLHLYAMAIQETADTISMTPEQQIQAIENFRPIEQQPIEEINEEIMMYEASILESLYCILVLWIIVCIQWLLYFALWCISLFGSLAALTFSTKKYNRYRI